MIIESVTSSRRGVDDFIRLPFTLYNNEKNWVPPIKFVMKEKFNKNKGAFAANNKNELFVAYRDGRPVGRVSAQIDKVYNEFYSSKTGFFGFYESENDPEILKSLMEHAEKWLKEEGCDECTGPFNPNINDECGFQIEGFDRRPTIMMPYTKPYYPDLFEGYGYSVAQVLHSFTIDNIEKTPEIVSRISAQIRKKHSDIEIRKINMQNLESEMKMILSIYNDAWHDNWGFTPMTKPEIEELVATLKLFADPRVIYLLFKGGEPAACLVAIPDLNELVIKNRNGTLNPSFLFDCLFHKRSLTSLRVIIMGVLRKFHGLGLDILLYNEIFNDGLKTENYRNVEMGWVLECNMKMNSTLRKIGAQCPNKYVIMRKSL
ncbi:MAG TPA: hypothetical protein PLW78_08895 [bacterium]|nr:hypothetical protein [bacterium]HRQ70404.1 hypothetical protein [bacterium]